MSIDEHLPLLEEILEPWKDDIGADYPGYRNHVYRMVHFCFALGECGPGWNDDARRKVIIAGCFHDLGIWSDRTFDYLPSSILRAAAYLEANALAAWTPEVELMIASHHKLRRFADGRYPLVEVFRRADLIDVSLGLVKFGLPGTYVREVKRHFPNQGFHKRLVQLAAGWAPRHPASPLPFLKW
jgi:hypothetical protein